jgi:hypothetical protein
MSEGNKKPLEGLDPNATIQIDQLGGLDQVELIDESGPVQSAPPTSGARSGPPALPTSSANPAPPPVASRRSGRNFVYLAVVCVVVIAAMAAGLLVGSRVRGGVPSATSASAASPAPPAPAPSASTLVLPTVEIGRH